VVEFSLAGGRYGLGSAQVSEVLPFSNCTPLPCTPPFIIGLVNVRGRFVHVIEVGRFLGLPAQGIVDLHHVLVVRHAGIELGVLADLVTGLRRVPLAALQPAPPALAGAGHLRGVTADGLVVLDASSILSDPRQAVDEEVGA
jgi:purine-binding chemotaxis protein CheW